MSLHLPSLPKPIQSLETQKVLSFHGQSMSEAPRASARGILAKASEVPWLIFLYVYFDKKQSEKHYRTRVKHFKNAPLSFARI